MVKNRSTSPGPFRAAAAVALLAISSWAGAQSIFGISPEDEKRIGREEHSKILTQFGGAYDDPNLARYVDSIGQFIAAASNAPEVGYTFTIIDSPIVNAFALPGGYVYLTRGLLALADNEAEVAGVLAHEIAHVTARHGAKRHTKGTLAGLGLAVLGAVTDNDALMSLGRVGAHAALSAYSRTEEYEADDLGVLYLSRAGFEPGAMSSFLDKLKRNSALAASMHGRPATPGLDFFATHPRTRDRVARAVAAARRTSVSDPIVGRNIYLSKIDGLLFGDGPEQGFVRGLRFVHPSIGFEFEAPPGFRLLNGERAVTGFGPEGARMYFDLGRTEPGRSLRRYLYRDWAAGTRLSRFRRTSVDGMDAVTAVARGSGGQPVRLAAIRFQADSVARFAFVPAGAPRSETDRHQRTSVFSFRRLSRWEARALKPWRVVVREVGPAETVDSLVARHFPTEMRMPRRTFRVLNGLPQGEPRAGDRVKLITE
ncbi:MAG: M48 family metalloprotease [Immundisolibacterales bacterium]|nr:M48 family metalloprotease [Immundisolibacterales bacterium]